MQLTKRRVEGVSGPVGAAAERRVVGQTMKNVKHFRNLILVVGFVAAVVFCPQANASSSNLVVHRAITTDLNGDGRPDHLIFVCYDAEAILGYDSFGLTRFILEILGFDMECGIGSNLDGQVGIVDIDTTDAFREIAIPESGPSSDDATHFFYFTGDSIVSMGKIPGKSLAYNGVGEILTQRRERILHTWFYPARYKLNGRHQLVFVEEEFCPMGVNVKVLSKLALRVSPTNNDIALVLSPGQTVTIVGGDDKRWCLVETADGSQGWFEVERYSFIVGTNKRANEVFDGLLAAD